MRSEEARIGEAVASLTARLTAWGVDEPAAKASDFIHAMLREGWRPRAPRYADKPAPNPGRASSEGYHAGAERARAELRANRTKEDQ